MEGLNLIVIFTPDMEQVLFCRRRKEPYLGLLNFVGGHIEPGEDGLTAAYRELAEETSLTKEQVRLIHWMDLTYWVGGCRLEVYVGRLRERAQVCGDENDLLWLGLNHDFFDRTKFAGNGNIGHIMEEILLYRSVLME